MRTRYFFALAAVVLLASCNKELQTPEIVISKDVTVLEVGMAPVSKTYMGEAAEGVRKVYWSNGDVIAVNGVASDALAELEDNTASASFTFQGLLSAPYNVLYPASIYKSEGEVELPAVQEYKAGGFADGVLPMAGYSEDGSGITIDNLCAILKVSVKQAATDADKDDIVSVRFKGRNDEQVSGVFAIDYQKAVLNATSTAAADKEVKVVKSQATSVDAAAVYFIVVPAGEYVNGFDVVVKDKNGHIMTKSKTSAKTLEAGHLYDMAAFEFVPTATEIGVEINSAAALVQFATDFNNKVYASLGDEPLVAALTADIVFDAETSAAFNATGGIGLKKNLFGASDAEDYYFNGIFNGGGYTISGLEATVPIFAAANSVAVMSNFNIADDCSFTFTHPNTAELDAGAAVGYLKGILKNVDVAADVALAAGEVSKVTALGGLVGRVTEGTIDNCTYSGNLSVPEDFVVSEQKTYIGGLVGSITNAKGKVQNSDFEGTIDFAGIVASTDKNDPYLRLGGIVGTINAGTVSSCEAKGTNTKEITMDNGTAYTATIQNHSRKAYHLAQGGIAGYNAGTVSDCTNGASVKNFVLATGIKSGTTSDDNSRYYLIGGIVGLNAAGATVTGCTNNELFESRSTPRIQRIGGIVGYNLGTVSSSSNSETGDITIASATGQSPYSLRVGEVGGAIGNNGGAVSNVQNAGDIGLSRTENNAGVEMKFGGVIGLNTATIDGGAGKNISNSGNINIAYNPTTVTTAGLRFGGIVGSTTASVKNVSNAGNVTYTLSVANNVMSKLYMGGIAGDVRNTSDVTVSECDNSGEVYFNVNGKAAAHTGNYIGGILGYIVPGGDASASISDCSNSGYAHIACSSTTASTDLCVSGIVGRMAGSGVISGCENAGEVALTFSNAAHQDNYAGGVIGKSAGVDVAISDCSNSGYVHGGNGSKQNGKTMYVGGIIAYLDGVSSIVGCENTGKLLNDQFNNTVTKVGSTFEGGIAGFVVGTADNRISISNVTNDVTLLDKNNQPTKVITGGRRGYTGGAVGYGEYVDITNATNNNTYGGGSGYYIGGIAGWVVNSTVTGSTYAGTAIETSQVQGAGGIVCTLDAGSVLDGCNSYLTTITHGANACVDGAVAAKSEAGSTIKNCHYKAGLGICSDSNFTDGGGNVADL